MPVKITVLCLCLFLVIAFQRELIAAPHIKLKAMSAVVMNAENGKILYAKRPDKSMQPASLTKILTLYLVHEAISEGMVSPSDRVKISVDAQLTWGSSMYIVDEKEVELGELIKGITVVSANDASVAVAEHLGGSVDRFVAMMNAKARKLGMKHSRFKNPNGLPAEGQVSTARDIARLSRAYIQKFPESLEIHAMRSYTFRDITQNNRNTLLNNCIGVDGLKTGFVYADGFHIIATAKRGETRIIVVVMGEINPEIRDREASRLIEAGFRIAGGGKK